MTTVNSGLCEAHCHGLLANQIAQKPVKPVLQEQPVNNAIVASQSILTEDGDFERI